MAQIIKQYKSEGSFKMYSVYYDTVTKEISCNCEKFRFNKGSTILKVEEKVYPCEHIKLFFENNEYVHEEKKEEDTGDKAIIIKKKVSRLKDDIRKLTVIL